MNETYARGSLYVYFVQIPSLNFNLYTFPLWKRSPSEEMIFFPRFKVNRRPWAKSTLEIYLGKRTKFSDFLSVFAPSSQSLSPTSLISLATSRSRASVTHFWLNFFFCDVFHLPPAGSTIHPKPWSVPRSWIGREEGSGTASRTPSSITRRKYVVMVVVDVGDLTNVLSTCIS